MCNKEGGREVFGWIGNIRLILNFLKKVILLEVFNWNNFCFFGEGLFYDYIFKK